MGVVLGIVDGTLLGIVQLQGALGSHDGLLGFSGEGDIQPLAVFLVLDLAGDGVFAGFHAQGAGQVYEEDAQGAGIGLTAFIDAAGGHGDAPGFGVVLDRDIVADPLDQLRGRGNLFFEMGGEIAVEGREELILHPGAQELRGRIVILQVLQRYVVEVFGAEGREHLLDALVVAARDHEGFQGFPVAAAAHQREGHVVAETLLLGIGKRLLAREERGFISMAEGVFAGEEDVVAGTQLRRDFRKHHILRRRNNGEGLAAEGAVQRNGELLVLAEGSADIAVGPVLGGPDEHVAQTCAGESAAGLVGVFGDGGVELGIVVDAEIHPGALDGGTVGTDDREVDARSLGVVVYQVDFREVGALEDHLFRTVVFAEHLGVHEHGAGSRGVEPAQVQHGFRLAGTQEVPLPVGPGFYPCVVVVGMGPAGSVHLTGGNAHAAEGRHTEGGLLTAAAEGVFHQVQRRRGASVGGLIGHLFMAPVVHFQDGVGHGQALDAGFELAVKDRAGAVQVFVVHPKGQHEVTEFPFGHVPAHFLPGLECRADILEVKI